MILTKEQFKETLEFVFKKREQENNFCNLLEEMSPDFNIPALIYAEYEEKIIHLLEIMFNDNDEDIAHLIYDLELYEYEDKKVPDVCCLTKDGKVLYNDLDSLYDYLVNKLENK